MKEYIKFQVKEKIDMDLITKENGIYNGFGRIVALPPTLDVKYTYKKFDSVEIGKAFISLGQMLIEKHTNIIDIRIETRQKETPDDMGKVLDVLFEYEVEPK